MYVTTGSERFYVTRWYLCWQTVLTGTCMLPPLPWTGCFSKVHACILTEVSLSKHKILFVEQVYTGTCKLPVMQKLVMSAIWQLTSLLCPFINPRRACASRVTVLGLCVCVSVCVSVTQHLTLHVFIRATNDTNLLGGGWRSKILSDFVWKCFVAKLERFLFVQHTATWQVGHFFLRGKRACVYESGPRG